MKLLIIQKPALKAFAFQDRFLFIYRCNDLLQ